MKVIQCDKCGENIGSKHHIIVLGTMKKDLCERCGAHVKRWLQNPEKRKGSFLKGLGDVLSGV